MIRSESEPVDRFPIRPSSAPQMGHPPGVSTPYLGGPGLKVPTPEITCRAFPGRLRTGGPEVADRWPRRGRLVPEMWKTTQNV